MAANSAQILMLIIFLSTQLQSRQMMGLQGALSLEKVGPPTLKESRAKE